MLINILFLWEYKQYSFFLKCIKKYSKTAKDLNTNIIRIKINVFTS